MQHPRGNLFDDLQALTAGERFTTLLACRNVTIERIQSSAVPDPGLYDQPQDEWVILLEGEAVLELAGHEVRLGPGDHLFIPARTPHRVIATRPDPRCLWLAVHIHDPAGTAP